MADEVVFPARTWALESLSEEEYARWERDGFVALPNRIPLELCRAAACAVREFVGADDNREASWYARTLDIYGERCEDGTRPIHGPCGMVQMFHHDSLWAIRQCPAAHAAFADVYGTRRLWVTGDRAHFKPPECALHPAWSDAGPEHSHLHWDVAPDRAVDFVVQGCVYLERTACDQGALRVVPRSHRRLGTLRAAGAAACEAEAVPVPGEAGTLVLWHSATLHGPGRNVAHRPRVSAYVAFLPVDAASFRASSRANDPNSTTTTADDPALSLADSGTLQYDVLGSSVPRLSRDRRVERWRHRLPLLDEDPKEHELERRPPGEHHAEPFAHLSPLGRRLVGLDDWPPD